MGNQENVSRLVGAMEKLFLKMQEVDSTCVMLTQDITKKELSLIAYIGKKEEVIMSEVSEFIVCPMSTTTGVVDKLVNKGYLKRFHSDEDRRTVKVSLTQYGKETFQLVQNMMSKMGNTILTDLNSSEQKHFIELLEKVTLNLDKHVAPQ